MEEDLEKLPLYDLRNIGRKCGVKSPCSMRKSELIEAIKNIKSGEEKPYFSNRGRPAIKSIEEEKGEDWETLLIRSQLRSFEEVWEEIKDRLVSKKGKRAEKKEEKN